MAPGSDPAVSKSDPAQPESVPADPESDPSRDANILSRGCECSQRLSGDSLGLEKKLISNRKEVSHERFQ